MRAPRMTTRRLMLAAVVVAILIVARPNPLGRPQDPVCLPPQIQGEVASADRQGERVELTIGSDDGLALGHEMFVTRAGPRTRSLGKIRIISLGYDQSVGQVLGVRAGLEFPIRSGDRVSLYPR
jgi:hypothetical protein